MSLQVLWECLQILKVTGPAMHASLTPQLLSLLPGLVGCCWHGHEGLHQAAASSAEALASAKPGDVLPPLLRCGYSHKTSAGYIIMEMACLRWWHLIACYETTSSTAFHISEAAPGATPDELLALGDSMSQQGSYIDEQQVSIWPAGDSLAAPLMQTVCAGSSYQLCMSKTPSQERSRYCSSC